MDVASHDSRFDEIDRRLAGVEGKLDQLLELEKQIVGLLLEPPPATTLDLSLGTPVPQPQKEK